MGVVAKVNVWASKTEKRRLNAYHARKKAFAETAATDLRSDVVVGLAARGDGSKLRDLLRREFVGWGDGANATHSAARTPALVAAAAAGQVSAVLALLDAGADADQRDPHSFMAPVHVAAAGGHPATLRALLERGADRHLRAGAVEDEGPTAHALATRLWKKKGGDALEACGDRARESNSRPRVATERRTRGTRRRPSSRRRNDAGAVLSNIIAENHRRCIAMLRLEPPVVTGVRVSDVDDRSVTVEWPVPLEHRRSRQAADVAVEAYRVTGHQVGLEGFLATRKVIVDRKDCEASNEQGDAVYAITLQDLPSLQCLNLTVAAKTAGLFGKESRRVVAFTAGRRPRPPGAPRLAGNGPKHFIVEFDGIVQTGVHAATDADRCNTREAKRSPNLSFECQLCCWFPPRAGHHAGLWTNLPDTDDGERGGASPVLPKRALKPVRENVVALSPVKASSSSSDSSSSSSSSDSDSEGEWSPFETEFWSDDERRLEDDPEFRLARRAWVMHCVALEDVELGNGVEPPICKFDDVVRKVARFVRSWPAARAEMASSSSGPESFASLLQDGRTPANSKSRALLFPNFGSRRPQAARPATTSGAVHDAETLRARQSAEPPRLGPVLESDVYRKAARARGAGRRARDARAPTRVGHVGSSVVRLRGYISSGPRRRTDPPRGGPAVRAERRRRRRPDRRHQRPERGRQRLTNV